MGIDLTSNYVYYVRYNIYNILWGIIGYISRDQEYFQPKIKIYKS